MRHHLRLFSTTTSLVVLAALAAGVATAATKRAAPTLVLVSRSPLKVAGRHFKPRSRVTVTLQAGSTIVRRATTNRQGSFTVGFGTTPDRCTGFVVRASQPGRASVILRGPRPMCAPAGTP